MTKLQVDLKTGKISALRMKVHKSHASHVCRSHVHHVIFSVYLRDLVSADVQQCQFG